ncbi:MAG: DUF5663 domain-containing protein [Candidatus Pacebacteria bacterium]|nr:DUF5663 domain-containing protein [Candidatus Paceibacterota bacterium]MDD3808648.1 DUF5663 domain-containing protein [Candidatus Paceibacterota bacterium]
MKQKPDFNDLDEEVLDQIKKDLKPRIENHINMAILKNIPQNKLEDFEKIVDSNDQEKIQAFCNENIPDLKEVIAMALISFRDSYMGDNY